jgi:hypothetical protein
MDKEMLRDFIQLKLEKRQLDSKSRKIEKRLKEMEPVLVDGFVDDGTKSIRDENGVTSYIYERLWARPTNGKEDRQAACEALKRAGLGHLVEPTFNIMTLSSYVGELSDGEVEALAEELGEAITITRDWKIGTRTT